jgi:GNAT superfamily N-acetyltransferase
VPDGHRLGRAELLDAAGHQPFARFAAARADTLTGFAAGGAVFMVADTEVARIAYGIGDPAAVGDLLEGAIGAGLLDGAAWVNLPRRTAEVVPAGFEVREVWDFRWSTAPVPRQPGQDRVVRVTDPAAVDTLLDIAFPEGELRHASPVVQDWYGIWSGADLVACAADRSTRSRDPLAERVAVIGGVAVHPEHRRRGLAAAVTAALTDRLRGRYELVALGVMADNTTATRIYERLGFTGVVEITSICSQDHSATAG